MIDPVLLGAALIPILGLMIALGAFRAPAHIAAPAALAIGALLAAALWSMDALELATAALEGMATAIWPIVLVIIAALFTFKLAESTGSLDTIKRMLSSITTDRRFQVLILVWGFGGFLEGVAGYGTAVAIPASLLVATGFDPLFAAFIALLANTVPTAFGAVGIPVATLAAVAGYPVGPVSLAVALQLSPLIVLIPFLLVIVTGGGFRALKGAVLVTLASGVAFVVPQLLAAAFLGTELPTILGSLCSLAATITLARRQGRREAGRSPGTPGQAASRPAKAAVGFVEGILAWLPYILVFFIILVTSPLVPPVHRFLDSMKTTVTIYSGPGATASVFKWVLTPGILIMIATLIAGLAQGARPAMIVSSFTITVRKLLPSTVTIVSILALAKIMAYAGMIGVIARALAAATGGLYPLFSPIIGALGTFVTGSDTTSNILFGKLQTGVASAIGQNPVWLAAANTAGATAGKMISPQSITVAATAIGTKGVEGALLRRTLPWCLLYVAALGLIVLFASPLSP
jgi:lactate permease